MEKAFSTDEYRKEDLQYISKVLHFISYKTIWRTFESCNNYTMPQQIPQYHGNLQYWYGEKEAKDRAWDIKYVKKHFPSMEIIKFEDMGHGSMATLYPQKWLTGSIHNEIERKAFRNLMQFYMTKFMRMC